MKPAPGMRGATDTTHSQFMRLQETFEAERDERCGAPGPDEALCVLPEGHSGMHEGNGVDRSGTLYRCWGSR